MGRLVSRLSLRQAATSSQHPSSTTGTGSHSLGANRQGREAHRSRAEAMETWIYISTTLLSSLCSTWLSTGTTDEWLPISILLLNNGLKKCGERLCTKCKLPRDAVHCGPLWTRWLNFRFHRARGVPWLPRFLRALHPCRCFKWQCWTSVRFQMYSLQFCSLKIKVYEDTLKSVCIYSPT